MNVSPVLRGRIPGGDDGSFYVDAWWSCDSDAAEVWWDFTDLRAAGLPDVVRKQGLASFDLGRIDALVTAYFKCQRDADIEAQLALYSAEDADMVRSIVAEPGVLDDWKKVVSRGGRRLRLVGIVSQDDTLYLFLHEPQGTPSATRLCVTRDYLMSTASPVAPRVDLAALYVLFEDPSCEAFQALFSEG